MFKTYKISTKFFLTYIVACLIPILISTFYLTTHLATFTTENTRLLTSSDDDQIQLMLMNVTDDAKHIIGTLISDPALTQYLTTDFNSDYDALIGYITFLDQRVRSLVSNQYTIVIYTDNPSIGISRITNNTIEDFYARYGKNSDLSKTGIVCQPINSQYSTTKSIGFYKVHTVRKSTGNEKIIYSIEIPVNKLLLFQNSDKYAKIAFLIDSNGMILASTWEDSVFCSLNSLNFSDISCVDDLQNKKTLTLDDVKYCAFYDSLQSKFETRYQNIPDWHLLYLVPYSHLQENLTQMVTNSVTIVCCCIVLSFILAISMSHSITGRLSSLGKKTKDVLNGNFSISAPITTHDEIGTLEANMYEMVDYLGNMVNDIYTANQNLLEQRVNYQKLHREKTEAELIALRRQINPHYLFNTLESIRMHLIIKGDKDTANIIKLFSMSFRSMLESSNNRYTLENELEFVDNYIKVQQYRLENKFVYEVNIPPELKKCVVPKLMLQPLVENALYHGIEAKLGNGNIRVDVFEERKMLSLCVTDDGAGFSPEGLCDLHRALNDASYLPEKFLALRNIQTRVQHLSGGEFTLTVESIPGRGTAVRLVLPCRYLSEQE